MMALKLRAHSPHGHRACLRGVIPPSAHCPAPLTKSQPLHVAYVGGVAAALAHQLRVQ